MFEEFNAKYEDFCWYEITNELSKNNIEKQAKQEIWPSSPLYAIIDKLEAVAKSERQDDVLFFDGSKYLAWNKGSGCGPRYKVLLPNELSEYLEWYQLNV